MTDFPTVDELIRLAKEDPEKLDEIHKEMVNEIIERQTDENMKIRLIALQSRIDRIQKKSNNHLQASLKMINLMNDKVNELNYVFKNGHLPKKINSAIILKFPD